VIHTASSAAYLTACPGWQEYEKGATEKETNKRNIPALKGIALHRAVERTLTGSIGVDEALKQEAKNCKLVWDYKMTDLQQRAVMRIGELKKRLSTAEIETEKTFKRGKWIARADIVATWPNTKTEIIEIKSTTNPSKLAHVYRAQAAVTLWIAEPETVNAEATVLPMAGETQTITTPLNPEEISVSEAFTTFKPEQNICRTCARNCYVRV